MHKINDSIQVSIDRIIKNHNIYGVDKEVFKKAYQLATKEPLNFFILDLKSRDPKDGYRYGFLDFLKLQAEQDA